MFTFRPAFWFLSELLGLQKTHEEEKAGGLEWDVDTEEPNSCAGLE